MQSKYEIWSLLEMWRKGDTPAINHLKGHLHIPQWSSSKSFKKDKQGNTGKDLAHTFHSYTTSIKGISVHQAPEHHFSAQLPLWFFSTMFLRSKTTLFTKYKQQTNTISTPRANFWQCCLAAPFLEPSRSNLISRRKMVLVEAARREPQRKTVMLRRARLLSMLHQAGVILAQSHLWTGRGEPAHQHKI